MFSPFTVRDCSSQGGWNGVLTGPHGRTHSYHGSLLCLSKHNSGRARRASSPAVPSPGAHLSFPSLKLQ